MIPEKIREGLTRLPKTYVVERGVAPALLAEAEQSLGFRLSEDVRAFVIEVGAIHGPSDSLAIMFPGDSLVDGQGESAYQFTLDSRQNQNFPPQTLVLDGRDYPFICLDVSDSAYGVFTYYDGRVGAKVASDFFGYLAEWIKLRIEDTD